MIFHRTPSRRALRWSAAPRRETSQHAGAIARFSFLSALSPWQAVPFVLVLACCYCLHVCNAFESDSDTRIGAAFGGVVTGVAAAISEVLVLVLT